MTVGNIWRAKPGVGEIYITKGEISINSLYDDFIRFMEEYFEAYSEYAQVLETQHLMDQFYAPELTFDEGVVTSREQWYERSLTHPTIQDKLTIEHLFIDEG